MMMATACVDAISMAPESFLECQSYSWLSPRISFSPDEPEKPVPTAEVAAQENADLEVLEKDFEFCLEDPVMMLPADELFVDGKLLPLQAQRSAVSVPDGSPEKPRMSSEICISEFCALSPKAPRCTSRWRELLGLKRLQNGAAKVSDPAKIPGTKVARSLKQILKGVSDTKSSSGNDSSLLHHPLLSLDSDTDSLSNSLASSRLSLSSSSSSGADHEDPPRFSLDSEKTGHNNAAKSLPNSSSNLQSMTPPRLRVGSNRGQAGPARSRIGRSPIRRIADPASIPPRGASVDSPRMNSSGKIIFQSLERSSSSPSSFNGGIRNNRLKDSSYRGMERSYSANVRVTPLLNVPMCTLRTPGSKGAIFGLFSQQKKESPVKTIRNRNPDRIWA